MIISISPKKEMYAAVISANREIRDWLDCLLRTAHAWKSTADPVVVMGSL
jgi:hypothetical protein